MCVADLNVCVCGLNALERESEERERGVYGRFCSELHVNTQKQTWKQSHMRFFRQIEINGSLISNLVRI